MIRARLLLGLCLLGAFVVMLSSVDSTAYAQKKKTETKQVTPEPTTPPPAKPSAVTLKDFLTKYKGAKTNLGMLVRVEADFFAVEDEGVTTIHPFSNIEYLRINKPDAEEENPIVLTLSMK